MACWWDPEGVPSCSCFLSSWYPFWLMGLLRGLDSESILWRELIPLWCVGVECVEEYGEGVEDSTPGRSLRYWHHRLPIFVKTFFYSENVLGNMINLLNVNFQIYQPQPIFTYLQQELLGLAWGYPSGYLRLHSFCELHGIQEQFHHNGVPCNSIIELWFQSICTSIKLRS